MEGLGGAVPLTWKGDQIGVELGFCVHRMDRGASVATSPRQQRLSAVVWSPQPVGSNRALELDPEVFSGTYLQDPVGGCPYRHLGT